MNKRKVHEPYKTLATQLQETSFVAHAPFLRPPWQAHDGIACSARNVLLKIEPDLQAMLAAHPTYKLVLTGHTQGLADGEMVNSRGNASQ